MHLKNTCQINSLYTGVTLFTNELKLKPVQWCFEKVTGQLFFVLPDIQLNTSTSSVFMFANTSLADSNCSKDLTELKHGYMMSW